MPLLLDPFVNELLSGHGNGGYSMSTHDKDALTTNATHEVSGRMAKLIVCAKNCRLTVRANLILRQYSTTMSFNPPGCTITGSKRTMP